MAVASGRVSTCASKNSWSKLNRPASSGGLTLRSISLARPSYQMIELCPSRYIFGYSRAVVRPLSRLVFPYCDINQRILNDYERLQSRFRDLLDSFILDPASCNSDPNPG